MAGTRRFGLWSNRTFCGGRRFPGIEHVWMRGHAQMKCLVNFILYDLVNVNVSHVGELTIYYISYADKIIVFYVLGANQGAHNTRRVRACRVRVYGLRDRPTRGTRRGCRDNLSSGPAQSCQDLLHYSKPKREPASEERHN